MSKRYDPDKQAVYHSEELTFVDTLFAEPLHTDDLMFLAGGLFNHDWWVSNKIPVPEIEPTTSKDRSSCATLGSNSGSIGPTIRVAPSQINPWTLAHEAAHVAQFHFYRLAFNPDLQDHGREFRACYLATTQILLGDAAAIELGLNFGRHILNNGPTILTVPRPAEGPGGVGIFPRWRMRQQADEFEGLRQRIAATIGTPRLNGAIAL